MQSQMQDIDRRLKGYWFRDGFGEIIGGLVFVLIGAYFALTEIFASQSLIGGILETGFILILLGLLYGGRILIRSLKNRFVAPRTGYLEYRVDTNQLNQRRIGSAVAAAVIAIAILFLYRMGGPINWLPAITGGLVGAILIFGQARSAGIRRFFYLGLISVAFGLISAVSRWPDGFTLDIYYAAAGLAFVISGSIVLRRFLI